MASLKLSWTLACLLSPAVQSAPAPTDVVRKDAGECARCHVISVAEWGCSNHRGAGTDCKACHGPSQGHVLDERNNVKPDAMPRKAAIAVLCRSCHEDDCPMADQNSQCQECHHVHALLDPQKPPSIRDERLEQLEVRWRRYSQLMQESAALVKVQRWESAQASLRAALNEKPGDPTALARMKMCERRMKPGLPGFEIVGTDFDEVTGLPREVRVVGFGIPMLLVSAGEFDMGSDRFTNTQPVHQVRVETFYLARHELTQSEWTALMGSNPSDHQGTTSPQAGRMPVEQVSWDDAQALMRRINDLVAGGGFRLPTEPEWEFVARAGGESGEAFDLAAPRAVELGTTNRLGFFDLAGNVREWCFSRLAPFPYVAADGRERGTEPGLRVLRGGVYSEPPDWFDPAGRHGERPNRRLGWNGVRLARSVPDAPSVNPRINANQRE